MNKEPNIFDGGRSSAAVRHYDRLKKDVDNKDENILISFPVFLRNGLIEGHQGWDRIVNCFDLLLSVQVHNRFDDLMAICRDVSVSEHISPEAGQKKSIPEGQFRDTVVVAVNGDSFTIQDFVLSIAYNGSL